MDTYMTFDDLAHNHIKICKSTISLLDEETHKTKGMITSIKTFQNTQMAKTERYSGFHSDSYNKVLKNQATMHDYWTKAFDLKLLSCRRLFFDNGSWYYIKNLAADKINQKSASTGYPEDLIRAEDELNRAIEFGAKIIPVTQIYDTRPN